MNAGIGSPAIDPPDKYNIIGKFLEF